MFNYNPSSAPKLDTQNILTVSTAQAVTYQFQVVEFMKDDKVAKVELQVQATTHTNDGGVLHSSGFVAVPRIQLPLIDHK